MPSDGAVRDLIEAPAATWNERDSPAFSRLFAEEADYVTGSGEHLPGRSRIHDELSARSGAGEVTLAVESIKYVGGPFPTTSRRVKLPRDDVPTPCLRQLRAERARGRAPRRSESAQHRLLPLGPLHSRPLR